jgi:NitT/TauT family transport system substrate-binding protein
MKRSRSASPHGAMTRRQMLAGAAGSILAAPAVRAQSLRKVRLTLPWVAQGSTLYPQVARHNGYWQKRGLDVEIFRGYGSFAALQAVDAKQFDFAVSQLPSLILSVSKDMPVVSIAITSYTLGWGIAVPADSAIRKPADLSGRRIGGTVTASDYIFLPEYLRRAGVDIASVHLNQVDAKLLEQTLIRKDFDAISAVVASSAPVFISQGFPVRFLPYRDFGLDAYGHVLATRRDLIENEPQLCRDVTDGLLEAVVFALTNPDAALDAFVKVVPEIELSSTGREFAKLGLKLYCVLADAEPARKLGLGYADIDALGGQTALITSQLGGPGARVPAVSEIYNPAFLGQHSLTLAQWQEVVTIGAPYASLFRSNA